MSAPLPPPSDIGLLERLRASLGSADTFLWRQRLLTERNTPVGRELLRRLVLDEAAPRKARLHGLWALVGTGRLEPEFHARLLGHADPAYRAEPRRVLERAVAVIDPPDAEHVERLPHIARRPFLAGMGGEEKTRLARATENVPELAWRIAGLR